MPTAVTDLRRFNRAYTQRIGVLDESFMGTGRPLGPSRLLFEIGTGGADLLTLRARLGLDSGYVSRMLRGLEEDGLVDVSSDPLDSRRRQVALTTAGVEEWHRLDDRSQDVATALLAPLNERRRDELARALRTAERLLRAATVRFDAVSPQHPLVRVALDRYFTELDARFAEGFDPGAGEADDLEVFAPPDGSFLLAVDDDRPVGCGGVCRIDASTAEIKRMWVSSEVRGAGVGRRLLGALEHMAVGLGYGHVVLDTNEVLTEAIMMYETSGYEPTDRYNDNPYAQRWFAKPLR
jgi:DNA-binding MarR family transcriptional regulator/GNAT superfamily N-acetyltransferase